MTEQQQRALRPAADGFPAMKAALALAGGIVPVAAAAGLQMNIKKRHNG